MGRGKSSCYLQGWPRNWTRYSRETPSPTGQRWTRTWTCTLGRLRQNRWPLSHVAIARLFNEKTVAKCYKGGAGDRSIECFHMTSRRPYWCPKTMKRRPCWCPKPILWEMNSFLMQTLSFVPINLHRCWPREWKHSIRNKSYKNCGNEIKWRMILAVVNAIYAITKEVWKKFRTSTGFEPVTRRSYLLQGLLCVPLYGSVLAF